MTSITMSLAMHYFSNGFNTLDLRHTPTLINSTESSHERAIRRPPFYNYLSSNLPRTKIRQVFIMNFTCAIWLETMFSHNLPITAANQAQKAISLNINHKIYVEIISNTIYSVSPLLGQAQRKNNNIYS